MPACYLGTEKGPPNNPFSPFYNSSGVGFENEDLIVWMRTAGAMETLLRCDDRLAALPSFRKLYRTLQPKIPNAQYQLQINYSWAIHTPSLH